MSLKKNKIINLCIHFIPFRVKVAFEVKIDKMAALTIWRGYEAVKNFDNDFFI